MAERLDASCLTCEITFKVDFFDCDPMGIVWHGNYINYFDRARSALLDKIGYGYLEMDKSGYLFPVTEVKVKYMRSLRFGDLCRAKAVLEEYENMIRMHFELYNAETGVLTTKGTVSQMCVEAKNNETQYVCPACFVDKVENCIRAGGF